jgi:hypothetical protein
MAFVDRNILIESFQDGDFPNGNDFANLIDSCYNYNLSALPEVFSFVQSASSEWKDAYTYVNANSSLIAFKDQVQTNYLNLTGGTVEGSINVINSLSAGKQILSAGKDLFDIFLTSETDSQRLSFNKVNSNLEIQRGNTISLSALRTIIEIPFTHEIFNPAAGQTYIFGQFSQLFPATNNIPKSICYISQHKGQITKVTAVNDFTDGSGESHTLQLVNRTQNISAVISNNLIYSSELVSTPSPLAPGTSTLREGLPGTWTSNLITPFLESEVGPLASGIRLDQSGSYVQTATIDATLYTALSVQISHRQEASGTPGGIELVYSLDGGQNFIDQDLITGVNSSTSTFTTHSLIITPPTTFTDDLILRFRKTESSLRRIRDIVVIGRFVNDTRRITTTFAQPLQVSEGDILDVRLATNGSTYNAPPTNVVNRVNATFYVEG